MDPTSNCFTFPLTIDGKTGTQTRPEQVMAMLMTKINNAFVAQDKKSNHYVYAVPNYLTLHEKCAYVEAAGIAGIRPLKIITDSSATAIAYAYSKRKELE